VSIEYDLASISSEILLLIHLSVALANAYITPPSLVLEEGAASTNTHVSSSAQPASTNNKKGNKFELSAGNPNTTTTAALSVKVEDLKNALEVGRHLSWINVETLFACLDL
jgi:hypothetical protein